MRALLRHWPLGVVVAAGATLRAAVMLAYNPFFWFTDTGRYVEFASLGRPDAARPWGYSGFLWIAQWLTLREVVAMQHALMLATVGALYAYLIHRGVARGVAALAVVPLSLSPLVVNVEHHLLSDWLFAILLTGSALALSWPNRRPHVSACAAAGLLLAGAVVTRQVALLMAVPLAGYLLLRRAGWLGLSTFTVAAAVPVLAYLSWVHATYGVYTFSTWEGQILYARVAPIGQCDRLGHLSAQQRELCDPRPPSQRPGPKVYMWTQYRRAPQRHLPNRVVVSFARRVITHQPVDYARMVTGQTLEMFYPGRPQRTNEPCVAYWEYPDPLPGGCRTDAVGTSIWRHHPFKVNRSLAQLLSRYQRLDAPVGPAMLACLVVVALALVRRSPRGRRLKLDALLFAVLGLGVTVAAFATADFSYRYTVPLYFTVPIAAALAVSQLVGPRGALFPSALARACG